MKRAVASAIVALLAFAASAATSTTYKGGGLQDAAGAYLFSDTANWSNSLAAGYDLYFNSTGASYSSVSNDTTDTYNHVYVNAGSYAFGGDLTLTGDFRAPNVSSGTATATKTSGDWTIGGTFRVGEGASSTGSFTHSGGTMSVAQRIFVGSANVANTAATFEINGGTVYANQADDSSNTKFVSVIVGFGNSNSATAAPGHLKVTGTGKLVTAGGIYVDYRSSKDCYLTIADNGYIDCSKGYVTLNVNNSGSNNNYLSLNGGTLETKGIKHGHNSSGSAIYLDGGTLKAAADSDNFINILKGNIRVLANGGTIDTAGYTLKQSCTMDGRRGDNASGDLTITGGGTLEMWCATNYKGKNIVDGTGTTLRLVASGCQNAILVRSGAILKHAESRSTRSVASIEFEDGATLVTEVLESGEVKATAAAEILVDGGLTLKTTNLPADGTYALLTITGGGTFADGILDRVTLAYPDADATLSLSEDRKSICITYAPEGMWTGAAGDGDICNGGNWGGGKVPSGEGSVARFGRMASGATLENTKSGEFAPGAIVFTANAGSKITLTGDYGVEGVAAVTNESSDVSHEIAFPVHFAGDIQVKQAAGGTWSESALTAAHVTFSGGAYAAEGYGIESSGTSPVYSRYMYGRYFLGSTEAAPWTATASGNGRVAVGADSSLEIPYAEKPTELSLYSNAAVTAGVVKVVTGARLCAHNYGEYVVAGHVEAAGGGSLDHSSTGWSNNQNNAPCVFKLNCVSNTINSSSYAFFFTQRGSNGNNGLYYIGEGGIVFANTDGKYGYYGIGREDDTSGRQTLRPWRGDFTLGKNVNRDTWDCAIYGNVTFCTDNEVGEGKTITMEMRPNFAANSTFTVSGAGTLLVKSVPNNAGQPAVTVTDTATLAFANNCKLVTSATGSMTVNGGATLKVAGSGSVPVECPLTLDDGAILEFSISGTEQSTFALSSTLTANGTVVIALSQDSVPAVGASYTLVSGAELTDASAFKLAANTPGTLSVENGELVYNAPKYFYIKVR